MKNMKNMRNKKNMKNLLIIALCATVLTATGCGKKNTASDNQAEVHSESYIANGSIGASEENGKVKINMPAKAFGDDVEAAANETKEIHGFEAADIEEDGSVTFTMTKEQQEKWVGETFENAKSYVSEVLSGFASLKEAELAEDFKTVVIRADRDMYKSTDSAVADAAANALFNCQSMSGVKKEDLKVTVSFVDYETGETIEAVEKTANN